MPVLRLSLIMAATALCLTGCGRPGSLTTPSPAKDFSSLSLQLQKDMSEQDVTTTIGSPPDKADLTTCVDHAGNPWQCKTWIYYGGRPNNSLRLVFYQATDKAWRVAAWQTY